MAVAVGGGAGTVAVAIAVAVVAVVVVEKREIINKCHTFSGSGQVTG